jgi:hypothetical protein
VISGKAPVHINKKFQEENKMLKVQKKKMMTIAETEGG